MSKGEQLVKEIFSFYEKYFKKNIGKELQFFDNEKIYITPVKVEIQPSGCGSCGCRYPSLYICGTLRSKEKGELYYPRGNIDGHISHYEPHKCINRRPPGSILPVEIDEDAPYEDDLYEWEPLFKGYLTTKNGRIMFYDRYLNIHICNAKP